MDKETKSEISLATVYFNGTHVGTNTDQNGFFKLNISDNKSMPLTISALGYYSTALNEYFTDTLNLIYLKPKVYELDDVVVTSKGDPGKRKAYLNLFRKEFLGRSTNAINCEILNEDDIIFSYDPDSRWFKAFSSNPIFINNVRLGYRIMYYLDKFEFCYSKGYGQIYGLIVGNYKFLEAPMKNEKQQKRIERRRKMTYMGSRMHFFRELWENNLNAAGFEIKDSLNYKVEFNNIVTQSDIPGGSDVAKYLKSNERLFISYYSNSERHSSIIKIVKDSVYFIKNGFFDPMSVSWEGEMSDQRIGDLLPLEYKSK